MNKLTSFMSKTMARTKVKAVKYGPAIAIGVGLVGMAGSLYLTYKASTKIEEAKKVKEEGLAEVAAGLETGFITKADGTNEIYSHEDGERDAKIYKSRYIISVVKHAAPAVALFILSGFLIFKGFKAEAARLATAGATIAGLTAQLADVKKELEDAVGKEKANDIMLGKHTTTETELKEDGSIETTEVTKYNRFVSGYTFRFDKESSPHLYSGIPGRDRKFIEGVANRANWLMNEKKGFVTFADILEEMEIPMDGLGYALTDGSVETPGHTIVFTTEERKENGMISFIITVNLQGFIANKI